mmetsp:Transcript_34077/g.69552  ORF Transcript_34077/g.69552 Transcript_34077/m.69552 type:complete len:85 (-) Transcript_34077:605-859(-)
MISSFIPPQLQVATNSTASRLNWKELLILRLRHIRRNISRRIFLQSMEEGDISVPSTDISPLKLPCLPKAFASYPPLSRQVPGV